MISPFSSINTGYCAKNSSTFLINVKGLNFSTVLTEQNPSLKKKTCGTTEK